MNTTNKPPACCIEATRVFLDTEWYCDGDAHVANVAEMIAEKTHMALTIHLLKQYRRVVKKLDLIFDAHGVINNSEEFITAHIEKLEGKQ